MTKNSKTQIVEDSFVSSDCSVFESNFANWYGEEKNRLSLKGYDTSKFFVYADPDINEGIIICAEYTMKFNRNECVIDLVINSEEDSLIWDDVVDSVPARFAAFLTGDPEHFLYRLSSNTSDKKEFYYFESTDDESGELLPISIDELNPLDAYKAEYFDELIGSIYNICDIF